MEVIKNGKTIHKGRCPRCACEFNYQLKETIKTGSYRTGSRTIIEYKCACPECGRIISGSIDWNDIQDYESFGEDLSRVSCVKW